MKTRQIVSLAIGSAVAAAAFAPLAQAADNPFAVKPLTAGYQLAQADKKADGKCGEAKCGADKKAAEKKRDGKCGEAKCGADKKADKKADGSCGADKKKDAGCGAKK
ncbi:MAG: hypothetical protein LWW83_10935 [Azonexaceae bacterium]|uniref:HvfA family oxazolone/thioamide-modified RiPP metallophore n=1 Tax=Azonexus sp. R2A61 TaxID=2744443 RepID=UPI001F293800|nr:hypothetical protein [Azonexus sp. R2A61]MCE1240425.1 hypothetical protein [Azonexaceae bacterium]